MLKNPTSSSQRLRISHFTPIHNIIFFTFLVFPRVWPRQFSSPGSAGIWTGSQARNILDHNGTIDKFIGDCIGSPAVDGGVQGKLELVGVYFWILTTKCFELELPLRPVLRVAFFALYPLMTYRVTTIWVSKIIAVFCGL